MDIKFQPLTEFHIDTLSNPLPYEMPFFHYHSCYEIFIVTANSRKMIIMDKILQGYKGDIFLIPPQYFHRTSGSRCARTVINFSFDYLKKYFNEQTVNKMLTCFDVFRISLSNRDFSFVLDICNTMLNSDLSNPDNTVFLELAKLLFFLCDNTDYHLEYRETNKSVKLASNILNYINDNYRNIFTLEEISDHFFITKEYLCRIFKKCVGVTPISYLNSLKLKYACTLLAGTRKNMTDIAAQSGFKSASYFSKIFKDNYSISPIEYRKLNCSNDIL